MSRADAARTRAILVAARALPPEEGVVATFYASCLIAANLNPKVIQARLGHATIAETMDTYGHLFPDAEDLGRGAMEAMLAASLAEQGQTRETQ